MASRAEWQVRVAAWRKSGLSAKQFAGRHGLKVSTLSWWSSTLRRTSPPEALGFARVVADAEPVGEQPLEVVLRSGQVVRVAQGFDPDLLRALVNALETQ